MFSFKTMSVIKPLYLLPYTIAIKRVQTVQFTSTLLCNLCIIYSIKMFSLRKDMRGGMDEWDWGSCPHAVQRGHICDWFSHASLCSTRVPPTDMIIKVLFAVRSVVTVRTFVRLLPRVDQEMPLHFGWPHKFATERARNPP